MNKGAKRLAVGTLVAGVAGYLAGVLTAPKSGRETRERIRTTANTSVTETERQLKQLHTELGELLNEAKSRGTNAKGQADKGLREVLDTADVAKHKVREILSAIHEGDAEDKDLQKAVNEASRAIKHIRAYLKK